MKQIFLKVYPNGKTTTNASVLNFDRENKSGEIVIDYSEVDYLDWDKQLDLIFSDGSTAFVTGSGNTLTVPLLESYLKKGSMTVQPIAKRLVGGEVEKAKWQVVALSVRDSLNVLENDPSITPSVAEQWDIRIKSVEDADVIRQENEDERIAQELIRESSELLRIENEIARNTFVPYSGSTAYQAGNKVSYLGSSYVAKSNTTGNLPTNTTYWLLIAQKGDNTTASDVTFTPTGNLSSTNVQIALAELDTEKVDKVTGKGLSTNDYTTIEKSKVANLPNDTNAQLAEIVQVPMTKLSRAVAGNVSSLKGWNKDFAGRLHIAVLGDSISEGAWADADQNKWNIFSWVAKLRQALSEVYGYGGEGFISLGTSRFVRTGTWTLNDDFAPHGYCYYSSGEANYVTLSGVYGDILDICYVNNAAISFKVSVDGGADQVITSSGPYNNQSVVATIALGGVGNHTIVIKAPASGTLFLQGAEIYIGTSGVVIHNFSRSGATCQSGAYLKMATRLSVLNHIQPKLTIINFLANDYNYQNSTTHNYLPNYQQKLLDVVNFIKSKNSDVLLWQPPDNGLTPSPLTWTTEEYEQASIGVAKSANVAWLNIHEYWGEYTDNTSKMYDTQHPNRRGHLDIARTIESVISQ